MWWFYEHIMFFVSPRKIKCRYNVRYLQSLVDLSPYKHALPCKNRMSFVRVLNRFLLFSVSTAHFWNEISFFFHYFSHSGMRLANLIPECNGMKKEYDFLIIGHWSLATNNKLPAHFNVEIKNDKIDINYLIIKNNINSPWSSFDIL